MAASGVLANDKDPKTASLTAVLVSDVSADEGVMVLGEDGLVIYDPGSLTGTTSFTYQARDPEGLLSNVATVTLAIIHKLSIADVSVSESAGSATLTIVLNTPNDIITTVDYATADGTATAPDDYTATSGTVTIAAGQTSTSIAVPIVDDSVVEGDESFTVTLSNPTSGASVGNATATVTILGSETTPTLTLVPAASSWGLAALVAGMLVVMVAVMRRASGKKRAARP